MAACGAKLRKKEAHCRMSAMANGRCRIHGGMTPAGIALPQTASGRYSRHLPTRMIDKYEAAKNDPELLVMRDEVALLDSRLADVLGRVDSGESGKAWALLKSLFADYRKAKTGPDKAIALSQIEDTIRDGLDDYAAWAEIGQILDRRARFVESERRRYVEMQQMVALDQALLLLGAVTDAIRRHVPDRDTRAALGRELERLADLQPVQPRALPAGRRRTG